MARGDYKIPFDKRNGNLLGYVSSYEERVTGVDWRDNVPFTDTLLFVTFARGRSAAHALFLRSDGTQVQMFLADLEDVLKRGVGPTGRVTGRWMFCKRGQNYGVCLVKEEA